MERPKLQLVFIPPKYPPKGSIILSNAGQMQSGKLYKEKINRADLYFSDSSISRTPREINKLYRL